MNPIDEVVRSMLRMPTEPPAVFETTEIPSVEKLEAFRGDLRMPVQFENGYTGSLIRHSGSYSSDRGLFEVAVVFDGRCVYDTPVTDDVEGNLTAAEAVKVLESIRDLPKREG